MAGLGEAGEPVSVGAEEVEARHLVAPDRLDQVAGAIGRPTIKARNSPIAHRQGALLPGLQVDEAPRASLAVEHNPLAVRALPARQVEGQGPLRRERGKDGAVQAHRLRRPCITLLVGDANPVRPQPAQRGCLLKRADAEAAGNRFPDRCRRWGRRWRRRVLVHGLRDRVGPNRLGLRRKPISMSKTNRALHLFIPLTPAVILTSLTLPAAPWLRAERWGFPRRTGGAHGWRAVAA